MPPVGSEELDEQGLLHVQAVLGLFEDPALRPVHDRRCDLLAAVGGQAVHRDRVGTGRRHQRVVDPVGRERIASLLGLRLLAHRRPGVGVDDGRPVDELERVLAEDEPAATGRGKRARPVSTMRCVRPVAWRMREPDLHADRDPEQGQRVVDVVAVTDERDDGAPRRPRCSRIVNTSARAWHGCSRRVRPLMTGIEACAASSTTTAWGPVRATIASTNRSRLWATSRTASRAPMTASSGR